MDQEEARRLVRRKELVFGLKGFHFQEVTGYARLEASAADSMNLNSGISELKFTVYGADGRTQIPFDWVQLVIVIAILIFAVILYYKVPIGQPYNLIMLLVLIAVAFYFAWPLMTTDYSSHAT